MYTRAVMPLRFGPRVPLPRCFYTDRFPVGGSLGPRCFTSSTRVKVDGSQDWTMTVLARAARLEHELHRDGPKLGHAVALSFQK